MIAPINKIIPFSNVDGPGNRCAIFFQSCNFKCLYCHNPETINMCNNCGKCVEHCLSNALSLNNGRVIWDKDKCINCDNCIKICGNSSTPKIQYMSVEQLVNIIIDIKPFIKGITVSGGECTKHKDFLVELFREVKRLDLNILIDSNGSIDFSKEYELMELVDGVMLDVKSVDDDFHNTLTSNKCNLVLDNLKYLLNTNKLYEARTVLLPNFMSENIKTVSYVSNIIKDKAKYKLIRYRKYGVNLKGIEYFKDDVLSEEDAKVCLEIALNNCCECIIL